jgi:hypothetical protein
MVGLPQHKLKKRPAKRRRFGREVCEARRREERKLRNRLAAADYRKRDHEVETEVQAKIQNLKEDISQLRDERETIRRQNELLEQQIAAARVDDGIESHNGYYSDNSDPSSPGLDEEPNLDFNDNMFLEFAQATIPTTTTTDIAPPPRATDSAVCDGSVNQVLKPSVFNNSPHTRPTRLNLGPLVATIFIHLIWLLRDQQTVDHQLQTKNQSMLKICSMESSTLSKCRSVSNSQPFKMILI